MAKKPFCAGHLKIEGVVTVDAAVVVVDELTPNFQKETVELNF